MNHGVYVSEQATSVATPVSVYTGIPFVVGTAPVQLAETPAAAGAPVLCTSWDEAAEKLGYSEDWEKFTLCEFMYSHFKLFGCQPVIFCNVLDAATMKTAVTAALNVSDEHRVTLPAVALNDDALIVRVVTGESEGEPVYATLVKGTDYDVYRDGETLAVELLSGGGYYAATALTVAYNAVNAAAVSDADVAAGIEAAEKCLTRVGLVPDLICAPGWSQKPAIAAAMATKAAGINGLFRAKALVDLDCGAAGVRSYAGAYAAKTDGGFVGEDEIVCWPMVRLGAYKFHLSTQLAGLMAQVDAGNSGVPYESPSNKNLQCDGLCLADGTEIDLTFSQANILNGQGIETALNFINGWVAWGSNTACFPGNSDVKDYHIPVSRMFDWVGNTLIRTFWSYLDRPMTRLLIDTVMDTANIWLSGLVGSGYLLGARVELLSAENPPERLQQGIVKLHIYLTPPSAAQEIDFVLEYDASYAQSALSL